MSSPRPLRIGLLAEGEAELGRSVPYLTPQDGGKTIAQSEEGALHALIRREFNAIGIADCRFVHRHPSIKEQGKGQVRVGHSILNPKYLSQAVIAWKPDEVDMIAIVVDSNDELESRRVALCKALETIRDNHLDAEEKTVTDQSAGGLAIKNLETWLLADGDTVQALLQIPLPEDLPESLEDLPADPIDERHAKTLLDDIIRRSTVFEDLAANKRELQIRWELGQVANLSEIRSRCLQGYGSFIDDLIQAARITHQRITPQQ